MHERSREHGQVSRHLAVCAPVLCMGGKSWPEGPQGSSWLVPIVGKGAWRLGGETDRVGGSNVKASVAGAMLVLTSTLLSPGS